MMYPLQLIVQISFLLLFPNLLHGTYHRRTLLSKNSSLEAEPQELKPEFQTSENRLLLPKPSIREVTSDHNELIRQAYQREVNDSIKDYYAQRKIVMDNYHARQKKIAAKFSDKFIKSAATAVAKTIKPENSEKTSPRYQDDEPWNNSNGRVFGQHRFGDRRNSSEETLVYQHNIGIGLKGLSTLNAAIEVLLDETITITCVELTPSDNSPAKVQILSGGPDYNFVKLKFTPEKNRGLTYAIKIWGVKV
ncbi:uncharacterized protein [Fopius arisanus]|uniref:Fbxo48_0 protein n=1 Tax=Fopius arisanus TaxID=64838 RepID=A0A0C9QS18_9HYME|nr:PREDICTED: uncharacterized protein LOC105264708 [Fopius arisanus]